MYDRMLLAPDIRVTEELFENSERFAQILYGVKQESFDKLLFAKSYLTSTFRAEWIDIGAPRYCCKSGEYNFKVYINVECNGDIKRFLTLKEPIIYEEFQWWWVGKACVYLRYKSGLPMREFLNYITVEEILDMYHLGHEVSLDYIWSKLCDKFK